MSPISRDDLHRIFKTLDKNNDGRVSIDELQNLLQRIGIPTTMEELGKLVGRDDKLDYIEFLFFYEAMIKSRMADGGGGDGDDLSKAFEVFDVNGDGVICCEELQMVLTKMGLWEKSSGHDCKHMIDVYDNNSDGVLDFEEFKAMMSDPPPPAAAAAQDDLKIKN